MEKYYTPTLEEFHIGFEFEQKAGFGDGTVKTTEQYEIAEWIKRVFSTNEAPYLERTMTGRNSVLHPPAVRVKYLDQEDIESLGWNRTSLKQRFHFNQDLKNLTFPHYVLEFFQDDIIEIFKLNYEGGKRYVQFFGTLKNKSELKRLMQQIGIK